MSHVIIFFKSLKILINLNFILEVDPIVIENGSFAWESGVLPCTLRNIDLLVKDGSLIAVVGVVGSGKSSMLSAMLGELEKVSGRVNTKVWILLFFH